VQTQSKLKHIHLSTICPQHLSVILCILPAHPDRRSSRPVTHPSPTISPVPLTLSPNDGWRYSYPSEPWHRATPGDPTIPSLFRTARHRSGAAQRSKQQVPRAMAGKRRTGTGRIQIPNPWRRDARYALAPASTRRNRRGEGKRTRGKQKKKKKKKTCIRYS